MKQKKLVMYFLGVAISILLIVPMFNTYFTYTYGTLNIKTLNKKQLFSTDNMEAVRNYIFYKIPKISLNKPQVIVGKDDFLFLGNNYAKIIDKTEGKFPYTENDIDKWTDKLKNLQQWYEQRDIKFVMVIASNKHTVYNNKLPNNVPYQENKTITDEIVKYAKSKNINILNLKDILRANKVDNQLYFTTDTHWNNLGASIGFKHTIDFINSIYNIDYKMPEYDLTLTKRASGDLAGFLKIRNILSKNYETNYSFVFNEESNVCHGNINKAHNLEKCTNKKNPYMGINRQDQYMINSSSLNNDKLLLLCDSFGSANSKHYNETFNTIWKFHYGHINGNALSDFVLKNKPDIVIYQVVERGLYNWSIVKKLSDITVFKESSKNIIGNKIFDINNKEDKYYKNNGLIITNKKLITTHNDPIIVGSSKL